MSLHYLQSNGDRSVIHTEILDGFGLRAAPVEAASWIAAKEAFGFELTPLQKQLLKESHDGQA